MTEQTAEQKAETMADTLIERLDKMPSMIPVDEVRETILDALNLAELVKVRDEYHRLTLSFEAKGGSSRRPTLSEGIDQLRAKVHELESQNHKLKASAPEHSPENRTTDP